MAEEKSRVTDTQLVGDNGTYTITGVCYDINTYHKKPCIYEGISEENEKVLIFQIDLSESVMYNAMNDGIMLGTNNYKNSKSCDKIIRYRPYKKLPEDAYEEFTKSVLKYIAMYKKLGAFYPDCSTPYLNCILDTVTKRPFIYIIVKYKKYSRISIPYNPWVMTEALKGLNFFHSNGFVYKYISPSTLQISEDKQVHFGFGGDYRDPLFIHGLIAQADFKSDIWCLGWCFMNGNENYNQLIRNQTIDAFIDVFNSTESELAHHNTSDFESDSEKEPQSDDESLNIFANLLARMTCFFADVRPTPEQALLLLEGKEVKGLPNIEEYIQYLTETQIYFEENKYCSHIEDLTVYNLLHQDYPGMYKEAVVRGDEKACNLIIDSPFAERVRQLLAMDEALAGADDPGIRNMYDKNVLYEIGKF